MKEISVLIVVRNAQEYIIECIKSIQNQFGENDKWEIIVIDGQSDDNTKLLAREYLTNTTLSWSILDNPKKTLAPGWNIGIRNAKGNFVVRPDAHSVLHTNYIKTGIQSLKNLPDVVAIGGLLETKSKGYWGNIIRIALSSKIGVGNSSFRVGKQSGYVDTSVYAIYRKNIFDDVGLFNENLVRHQDNEMHRRIKKSGGKFYLNIDMKASYYCRDTIPKLLSQMFNIGRYLPDVMGTNSLSLRHLAPFAFYISIVLGLAISHFIYVQLYIFIALIFGLYLFVILVDTLVKCIRENNLGVMLNIFIIPLIHFTYGLGTLFGLIGKVIKRVNLILVKPKFH